MQIHGTTKLQTDKDKDFNADELDQLVVKAQAGDKEALASVMVHLDLMIRDIASSFKYKNIFEDLYQEGVLGILHAIKKYDNSKGFHFSTYCYRWIYAYMQRYLQNNNLALKTCTKTQIILRQRYLLQSKNPHLTDDEIYDLIKNDGRVFMISKETYNDAIIAYNSVSFEAAEQAENKSRVLDELLANVISDEEPLETRAVDHVLYLDILDKMDEVLNEREKDCVLLHLGINTEIEETLQSIADKYNVSRERIRVIYNTAIIKIQDAMHVPLQDRAYYQENLNVVEKMVYKYLDQHPKASFSEVVSHIPKGRASLKPPIYTYYDECLAQMKQAKKKSSKKKIKAIA